MFTVLSSSRPFLQKKKYHCVERNAVSHTECWEIDCALCILYDGILLQYVAMCFWMFFILFFLNHYAPINQAKWCNMNFTAGSHFASHSLIGWPNSSPHWDLNAGSQIERQITYQLSYPSTPSILLVLRKEQWFHDNTMKQTKDIMTSQSCLWYNNGLESSDIMYMV